MYEIADFNNADSITVIGRGLSLSRLDILSDKIDRCMLVGQHENSMKKVGRFLKGKRVVACVNKTAYTVHKSLHKKFGIIDIQMNFPLSLITNPDQPMPVKARVAQKTKDANAWGTVHFLPEELPRMKHKTTGLCAIDIATLCNPKKIYIIGIDFYHAKYFCKEKKQAHTPSRKGLEMRDQLLEICRENPNIQYEIYTMADIVPPLPNLKVIRL